jgi:hypothetical protein
MKVKIFKLTAFNRLFVQDEVDLLSKEFEIVNVRLNQYFMIVMYKDKE